MVEKKIVIGIIGIVIIVFGFLIIKFNEHKIPEKMQYFTPDPATWVENNDLTDNKEDVVINLMRATEDKSQFTNNKLEYFDKNDDTAFFYHGFYIGNYFDAVYLDPEFYKLDFQVLTKDEIEGLTQKHKLMEITQEMDPNDGIIQSFIIAKKDSRGFIFYILVDEDWKNKINFTNIVYGRDFNDKSTLLERPFNFEEIKNGVYMDKIDDYNDWYNENPVNGGIMLGGIKISDLSNTNLNSTFIIMR